MIIPIANLKLWDGYMDGLTQICFADDQNAAQLIYSFGGKCDAATMKN